MRILLLTQWFTPEPFFKGLPFAKQLAALGHDVEVLTGFPNYPEGKVYPGYRIRLVQRELMEGIPVIRVPLYPSHDRSGLRRSLNYLSFATSASCLGPLLVSKPDVIYAYHPPGTVGLPALVLKALKRAPVVYDIQDIWADTIAETGMLSNRALLYLIERWCRYVYQHCDKVVVLSPGAKELLISKGVSPDKVEVVFNWCEEEWIYPCPPDAQLAQQLGMTGRFNVVFAGNMGTVQGLDTVLDAAKLLATSLPQAQFVLVGGGVDAERLKARAAEMGLTNVIFLPRQPTSAIRKILALADVLLVHLKDRPLFWVTIPSKTQAYMAAGRPILMAVRGESADLVRRAGAGIVCEPESPQALATAVKRMYHMPREELIRMGQNGRKYYEQELSLHAGVKKFVEIFESVQRRR